MLNGIHFLLTYKCNFSCDHCFLYSDPYAKGVFTLNQLNDIMVDARTMEIVDTIYFEGGEPFLYYPVLQAGIKSARKYGFSAGVVTNAYWATSVDDAMLWLAPLQEAGLSYIGLSDDVFHYGTKTDTPPKNAHKACGLLGLNCDYFCIDEPTVKTNTDHSRDKGEPIVGGNTVFKGRAVEKLVQGLPKKEWKKLGSCTREKLDDPGRVHIDPFGNVHLCQGMVMGNVFDKPLSELIKNYDAVNHPIAGPLLAGGPANLAETYQISHEDEYVDECHFCYSLRKSLMDRFPRYLTPRQVYGEAEK